MYKKGEASEIRQTFWTSFGKYMAPIPSAEGNPQNWINYKSGIKNLYFRMDADQKHASIKIEIAEPNSEIQELFFQRFLSFKEILQDYLGEEWDWKLHTLDENGKITSRIGKELNEVNIFNRNDWQKIISFLKPRIIALDLFLSEFKDGFMDLK